MKSWVRSDISVHKWSTRRSQEPCFGGWRGARNPW